MKGNPITRMRSEEILSIINNFTDEQFLNFYEQSLKKKDFCNFLGITYSTSNFKKINDRLKCLGINDTLIKFKAKQKLAFKIDLENRLNLVNKEMFKQIFDKSSSVLEMCQLLGFNYKNAIILTLIRKRISDENLPIEKFKVREWDRENTEKILVKSSRFRGNLSKILKRFSIIPCNNCQECGISEWNGKQIVLELHHIDGDNTNNMKINLTFLCPNCHSLTDNHRNKKRS